MGKISKTFALFLILIMAFSCLSLLMVKPASAQSIPTPSVPEFTSSYYVQNRSIVVTIKNQPFSYSYKGTTYSLYYDVRIKWYFGQDWTELYPVTNIIPGYAMSAMSGNSEYVTDNAPSESNSDYTVLSYLVGANGDYPFTQIPPNSQVDLQVKAIVGHSSQAFVPDIYDNQPIYVGTSVPVVIFDTSSGWSNTVTITVGFYWLEIALFIALAVIVALIVATIIVRHHKTGKTQTRLDAFIVPRRKL